MARAKYALLVRDNENQEWSVHRNRLIYYLHELAYEYKTYLRDYPDKQVMPVEIYTVSPMHIEAGYKRHMEMARAKYALLVRDNENQEWSVHRNRLIYYLHELAYEYKTYLRDYPDKQVMPVEIYTVSPMHIEAGYKRHMAMMGGGAK